MPLPSFQSEPGRVPAISRAVRQALSVLFLLTMLAAGQAKAAVETEPNESALQANVLTLNVLMQGQLSSATDQDWFSLTVSGATTVRIAFDSPQDLPSPAWEYHVIRCEDSVGTVLCNFGTASDKSCDVYLPASGAYYISVRKGFDNLVSAQYGLTVSPISTPVEHEPNNFETAATAIQQSVTIAGQISSTADQDWYRLVAGAAGTATITFDSPKDLPSPAWEYHVLKVRDAAGTVYATAGTASDITLNVSLPSAQAYFIVVTKGTDALLTDPYTIRVSGLPSGTPPVISDITDKVTDEDTPMAAIPFTVGDADLPAGSLTLTAASTNTALLPVGNILFGGSDANRTVTLVPAADQSGISTVTVTVSDGTSTKSDTFLLSVNAVNDVPQISDIPNQTVIEDTPTGALPVSIADVETSAASLTLTQSSSNTNLIPTANIVFSGSGANRFVTITPAPNQSGTATITITVSDGVASAGDTFNITVSAVNDPPTISDIPDQSVNEDTSTGALGVVVGDAETALDVLILTAVSSNTTLVPVAGLVPGGTGANRTLAVTPAANLSGTTTITLTVSDGAITRSDSFVLTVLAVNDAPTVSNITDKVINEDTVSPAYAFTVGDVESAAGTLTVSGSSSNTVLLPAANIVFGGTGANRTVTLMPAANQTGSCTVTVTASDGTTTGSDTFLLTVNNVNDAPTISDVVNQTVSEDNPTAALAVTIGDPETAPEALTLTGGSSNTTLVPAANIVLSGSGANRFVTVTPAANQSGSATITLTVGDGTATRSDTFILTVTAVNDLPTIADVADRATNEDTATAAIPFSIGDVETSAALLTVTRTSSNTALVPLTGVVLGGAGANRTVTITPAANQFGSTTITLTVSDGTATSSDTFVLTVNPVNDGPVISNVANVSTNEDTPTAAIAFTISDPETPAAELTVTGGSSNLALVPLSGFAFGGAGGSRTVVVTPALNQTGTSTITLTVSDGMAAASDTFVLTVNALNDAPVISEVANLTLLKNAGPVPVAFTIGDAETAAASLTVSRGSSNTALLPLTSVVMGGSGASRTVTLTPAVNQTGSATVTLTVSDGILSANRIFTVTVTDLPPLGVWRQAKFGANAGNEGISGDLANPDGDQLVNLLEYAFGGDPNFASAAEAPVSRVSGNRVSLAFTRVVANTDVTIVVQGADSLGGPWTDLAQSTAGNAMTVLAAGAEVVETGTGATRSVEVRDAFAVGQEGHPQRFLRVKVSH